MKTPGAATSQEVPEKNDGCTILQASNPNILDKGQWEYENINVSHSQKTSAHDGAKTGESTGHIPTGPTNTTFAGKDEIVSATDEKVVRIPDIEDVVEKVAAEIDEEPLPILDGQVEDYLKADNRNTGPAQSELQMAIPNLPAEEPSIQTQVTLTVPNSSISNLGLSNSVDVQNGNNMYQMLLTGDPILIPIPTPCNNQLMINSSRQSYFDDAHFKRLASSKILHQAPTEIGLMTGDVEKSIITTFGKRAFNSLFDENEIKAGCSSGKSTKVTGESSSAVEYDKDKLFLAATFVSWLLNKPHELTMDKFKEYAENQVKQYNTGLNDNQMKTFKGNVIFRHACDRRNELCGIKANAAKRKSEEAGEISATKKKRDSKKKLD